MVRESPTTTIGASHHANARTLRHSGTGTSLQLRTGSATLAQEGYEDPTVVLAMLAPPPWPPSMCRSASFRGRRVLALDQAFWVVRLIGLS